MNETTIYNAIASIDDDLIERSGKKKTPAARSRKTRICISAIAAGLAIIAAVGIIAGSILSQRKTGIVNVPQDPGSPAGSEIKIGNMLSGRQDLSYGKLSTKTVTVQASMNPPGFYINTVIEAEVIEVLPDTYRHTLTSSQTLHVAKLRVTDQIRGNGLPEELYLEYPNYNTTIFDGYERFILSIRQTGIADYALVNQTKNRIEYFPQMFEVCTTDLGYGSVIAFNGGQVDDGFWEKADFYLNKDRIIKDRFEAMLDAPGEYCYPAARNMAIDQVKSNILALADDPNNRYARSKGCDYITVDDVFILPEAKEVKDYLAPSETNAFCYDLIRTDHAAEYVRVINGFKTDEKILVNGGNGGAGSVVTNGVFYTEDDLSKAPDIGSVIANLDLSAMTPPHTDTTGMKLVYSHANGIYRKIDGKVYGIVRIVWCFTKGDSGGYYMDDTYYVYDEDGTCSILERDELKELIGDGVFIYGFQYGVQINWFY